MLEYEQGFHALQEDQRNLGLYHERAARIRDPIAAVMIISSINTRSLRLYEQWPLIGGRSTPQK
ncbi:MAG: hypothetical protein J0I42_06385 [Bosea sp.]|uniref:hypothetical protein n=1 Tax=unclassified Bosea (in: a-proteobacteria) TaxID=2653178 RepID=UPI0012E3D334|nr:MULTISPECIES: hypothetical protein [unclassified Bosea (in: a-proteobacteria)]MBN9451564.1 hypothetical protein [Bosea sp. (in: a-proteobacteria)]